MSRSGGGAPGGAPRRAAPLCRLCLSARDTAPIFSTPSVASRILACVHIQVDENDGLPSLICRKCLQNVDNWHAFKKVCEDSQAKLRDWLGGDADCPEVKIKNEPTSEDDDITIDASYPGVEAIEDGGRSRLQPEGPPILASLGLAPRNEKESDEEIHIGNGSMAGLVVATLSDEVEQRPVPVEQLASKDCLVCGRAYRYSHNARRHERNAHSYDRYTNKIEPGSPNSSLKSSSFNPNMRFVNNSNEKSNYYSKLHTKNTYFSNNKMRPNFHLQNGEPAILKSLLTRTEELSESDNYYSDSDSPSMTSEPDISSYQVETVLSVPDAYAENSSDDDNDIEMGHSRSGKGADKDVVVKINSQSDINRIIGIEDDDEDDATKEVTPEETEDVVPPIADNIEVDNVYYETVKTDVPDEENKLDSDEGSHDEDDDDMRDPTVPIVEINENHDNTADSELDESDAELNEQNDTIKPEKAESGENFTITTSQKQFIDKYRDLIEQINTLRCKCCDKDFPRRKAVIQHLQKNGCKIPKHTCYTCVLSFTHIGALLSHMRYNCCNETWKLIYKEDGIPDSMVVDEHPSPDLQDGGSEEILKFPYKDVLNARSYICKLCPAKYQLKQFIMKHVLDAHESRGKQVPPLTCFNCKHKFGDHRLWKKHLRNGECTMLIQCDICSEKFLNMQDFNEHAVAVHAEEFPSQANESHTVRMESRPTDCPICDKGLSSYHNLVKHLKMVHNESKPHMCQYCESKFKHYTDLSHHVYLEHSNTPVNGDYDLGLVKEELSYNYSCTECSAVFETVDGWTEHQISVHHHVAHECDQCNKKFWDESELDEHKASHYRTHLYKCTHCSNSFSSSQRLSEHMTQYHRLSSNMDRSMESQFYCEICIRSFKSRQAFSNHMRIHAKVPTTNRRSGDVKRPQSEFQHFQNRSTTNPKFSHAPPKPARQIDHAPYSCDICGKGFLHKKNIWKHKKMLHPDIVNKTKDTTENSVPKNVSTEEEDYTNDDHHNRLSIPQFDSFVTAVFDHHDNSNSESALMYQCDLCDKRFAVKSSIWKHKRVKHGVMNPNQPETSAPETKKAETKTEVPRSDLTRISCTICKISFSDKKAYYRHRKVVHKSTGMQTCTICGITLNTSIELYEHLQTSHAKELLVTNANQGKPQKKMQASRPRNSSDDDEMVTKVTQPKNHRESKYSCEVCGKHFHDVSALQKHACAPRMPMTETYDCEICKKSYTSISALKSHRGWHLRSPDGRAAFSNSGLWMPQNKVTNKVSKHEVVETFRSKVSPSSKEITPMQIKRKLPPDVQVAVLKKKKLSEEARVEPMSPATPTDPVAHQLAMKEERFCEPCGKTFTKKAAYQRHIEEVHKASTVFCPICNKSFTRKSTLLVHMRKHDTGDISEPPDPDDSDDDMDESIPEVRPPHIYRCEICNMQHNSSKALRRHRLKHHEVGGREHNNQVGKFSESEGEKRTIEEGVIKEYKCGLCDEEWDTAQEVLNHPHYRCSHCGLYFSLEQNLEAHIRTRHSDKQQTVFSCDECDRFYMNKRDLQRHMKNCASIPS